MRKSFFKENFQILINMTVTRFYDKIYVTNDDININI